MRVTSGRHWFVPTAGYRWAPLRHLGAFSVVHPGSLRGGGGLISLWLYKENNKLRDRKKCIYSTYPPPELHTLLTSLTHPRKILLVVLQIGKAKDLSAPLRIQRVSKPYIEGLKPAGEWIFRNLRIINKPHEVLKNSVSTMSRLT
jgi:hypothetical protein